MQTKTALFEQEVDAKLTQYMSDMHDRPGWSVVWPEHTPRVPSLLLLVWMNSCTDPNPAYQAEVSKAIVCVMARPHQAWGGLLREVVRPEKLLRPPAASAWALTQSPDGRSKVSTLIG